jgi:hypothetical protein
MDRESVSPAPSIKHRGSTPTRQIQSTAALSGQYWPRDRKEHEKTPNDGSNRIAAVSGELLPRSSSGHRRMIDSHVDGDGTVATLPGGEGKMLLGIWVMVKKTAERRESLMKPRLGS